MSKILSPCDEGLNALCDQLIELGKNEDYANDLTTAWPSAQLKLCGEAGVFEWFLPQSMGGQGWSEGDIYRGYLALSAACMTTTFVITQRMGACRRIASGESQTVRDRYLAQLITGELFTTVGVSHLTTSGRHLAKPMLRAVEEDAAFVLDGRSPWVTGGEHADLVVLGATLDDGREILAAAPTNLAGISRPPSANLVGLRASCTGAVLCDAVRVPKELIVAGPRENVMQRGTGASTGGLQTSVLAIGLASACLGLVQSESARRPELDVPLKAMMEECESLSQALLAAADGQADCNLQDMRVRANSLVMRASQAALAAAKGAGYVVGHPAGRWCREALFFLVWSCPQAVMNANLCELAGIDS